MTRDEILGMEAGLKIDELIAEKVFNHCVTDVKHLYEVCAKCNKQIQDHSEIKEYSTDIEAAWKVVEKLTERQQIQFVRELEAVIRGNSECRCSSCIFKLIHATPEEQCKAALLAVMEASND
jgi:hypothetical protein